MAIVTIDDDELDTNVRGAHRKRMGALGRFWVRIAGAFAVWCVRTAVSRLQLKIDEIHERYEIRAHAHAVEKRKQQAEIDALRYEVRALAELHVNMMAKLRLGSIQSQRQIDLLKSPEE